MSALIDRRIRELAERQYGHVTRPQLLALGLGSSAIEYRIKTGKLIVVHAGVYGVGHEPSTPVARAAAAVLACGPGAVLSLSSARRPCGVFSATGRCRLRSRC